MANSRVIIATSNEHKLLEFRRMLEPLGFDVVSLKDVNLDIDVEETGKTFEENALIKADCIASKAPDSVVIADDSGLEVHALNGFPGIYSARFMEGHPYLEKQMAIIEMLKGKEDTSANFTSAIALVNFKGRRLTFVGKSFGHIVTPSGCGGFGYDPIFLSDELHKTFGEATSDEKDRVSHRGKAIAQLLTYLKENL